MLTLSATFLITSTIILISYRFLPRDMVTRLLTSKKQDSSTTQTAPVLLLKNPLGTILNLLVVYSLWWSDIYARNKYIALTIISVKILLIISLPPALAIFYWNRFGTGTT